MLFRNHVDFIETPNGLKIKLNESGYQELRNWRDDQGWLRGTLSIFHDLIEDHLCNGWEIIHPEEIGALTSAPILSKEGERDNNGKLLKIGKVYWFPAYEVVCEVEELLANGEVFFPLAAFARE